MPQQLVSWLTDLLRSKQCEFELSNNGTRQLWPSSFLWDGLSLAGIISWHQIPLKKIKTCWCLFSRFVAFDVEGWVTLPQYGCPRWMQTSARSCTLSPCLLLSALAVALQHHACWRHGVTGGCCATCVLF